jgi:hypothetical protein
MENKYYVPDIEEFRIGFEYEYHEHFGKDFGKWNKYTVTSNTILEQILNLITSGSIRVKYLDKEDIESCGFELEYSADLTYSSTYTRDCPDSGVLNSIKISLQLYPNTSVPPCIIILKEYKDGTYGTFFNGTIKNLSELKVLLKQLNLK